MQDKQVEGEVIDFIVPNYQIHGDSCNTECHGIFLAAVTKVFDREFGNVKTLDVFIKKSYQSGVVGEQN